MPRPSKLVPRSLKGEFRERGGSPRQTAMQYCVRGAGSQAPKPRLNQGDRQHFRLTLMSARVTPPGLSNKRLRYLKPPTIVIPSEAKGSAGVRVGRSLSRATFRPSVEKGRCSVAQCSVSFSNCALPLPTQKSPAAVCHRRQGSESLLCTQSRQPCVALRDHSYLGRSSLPW